MMGIGTKDQKGAAQKIKKMANWIKNIFNKEAQEVTPKFGTMSIHETDWVLAQKMLKEAPGQEAIGELEASVKAYLQVDAVYAFGQEPVDALFGLLPKGSIVVAPAFIYKDTAAAMLRNELKIKWVDVELESFGPKLDELKTTIEDGANALFLPHFLGLPSNYLTEILELCQAHDVLVIEDCRHAAGALFDSKPLGSFGDMALFSFNAMMPINTMQGGMIAIKNNVDFSERIAKIQADAPTSSLSQKELLEAFIDFYEDRKVPDKGLLDIKHGNKRWEKKWTFSESKTIKIYPAQAVLAKIQFEQAENFAYYRQNHLRLWQSYAEENNWLMPKPIALSAPGWLRAPVLVPEQNHDKAKSLEEKPEIGRWYCEPSLPEGIDLELFPNTRRASQEMFQFPTEM